MGFLIQSTKNELKIFRDNSVEPFFEIPKALISKRMLESLIQAYDFSEDLSSPETSDNTEEIPKPVETAETNTTKEDKEPEEKPEPEETKPTKKRRTK